jgi:hypothetical protein
MSSQIPAWSPPDRDGKPVFHRWGDDGPPMQKRELRRYLYRRAGMAVRVRLRLASGKHVSFYRVVDPTNAVGWQGLRPSGYLAGVYAGAVNPFDPALASDPAFWPEAEEDCEAIGRLGLPAFTFGAAAELPAGCEHLLAGRTVVVLGSAGHRAEAMRRAALALLTARIITVVEVPGMSVSGWIADGHGVGDLLALWKSTPPWRLPVSGGGPVDPVPISGAPHKAAVDASLPGAPVAPFDRREIIPLNVAAEKTGKSDRTLRNWCARHGIGRRIGGEWALSRVALAMFLDCNADALQAYRDGARRSNESVARYYRQLGLGALLEQADFAV